MSKYIKYDRDFLGADSVDSLMVDTHELGGSTVVVDRATPKASCGRATLFSINCAYLTKLGLHY